MMFCSIDVFGVGCDICFISRFCCRISIFNMMILFGIFDKLWGEFVFLDVFVGWW